MKALGQWRVWLKSSGETLNGSGLLRGPNIWLLLLLLLSLLLLLLLLLLLFGGGGGMAD